MKISKQMGRLSLLIVVIIILPVFLISCIDHEEAWSITQKGNDVQIAYGKGTHFPQYASLDLNSSYFRMIPRNCAWGTSIIPFPSFWEGGK